MDIQSFDQKKIDEYSAQAETLWGKTEAYQEYAKKAKNRSHETSKALGSDLMEHFAELGRMKHKPAESEEVQNWVKSLQDFITAHYYTCTKPILKSLGEMYADGGSMTENIDAAGGAGTGAFAKRAIDIYCEQ